MEQVFLYVCAAGGFAGIAAILTVFVNHAKNKKDNNLDVLKTQMQGMQASFESNTEAFRAQIQAMQTSFDSNTEAFRAQIQAMQTGFDSQLRALTESVNSWKGLWEASTQEIRELKMEIKELRSEIDKLRTENAELKGQLKEHYKLA
jgi:chromosome segregation ATPase